MSDESRIDELLDLWEESVENGNEIDLNELCSDEPQLIKPLQSKIDALKRMNSCFEAFEKPPAPVRPARIARAPKSIDVNSKLHDLDLHDRGGLGAVYKANDEELHREVAVKFLNSNIAQKEEYRDRFLQEAEITGRLDHPGVVPVYACGESEAGHPFYVMRFIRGDTYDDGIRDYHRNKLTRSYPERQLARQKLLVQLASVCKTIGYSHTRGIVHRDIKPKNIMLGKYGETLVVDWGLAIPFQREGQFRVLDEKTLVPQSSKESSGREGEGTPVFMSPEQAAGKQDLGPASDIYSLGVVLYRVLTGKFAFDGDSPVAIRTAIMKGDFMAPRQIDRSIPADLEAICLKAMSLLPTDRYPTALDMAEDIENFLADVPVNAHRYSLAQRTGKFIQQYQSQFITLLVTAIGLTMASMFVSASFYNSKQKVTESLITARISQVDTLNMTCRMTAKSIRYNLEARLIALEQLASTPSFLNQLEHLEQSGSRDEIFNSLKLRRDSIQKRYPSVALLLLDDNGQIISEYRDEDMDTEDVLWHLPYFHGGDMQLDKSSSVPPPVSQPMLSPVYFCERSDRELCSLSVPVKNAENSTIGVLVMEIQMGQFDPLIESDTTSGTSSQRFVSLVETRGDLKGALLHHPGLKDLPMSQIKSTKVCESVFDKVIAVDCDQVDPQPISDYIDPIGGKYDGEWNSLVLPIQIHTKRDETIPCGWYLMVQDRPIKVDQN